MSEKNNNNTTKVVAGVAGLGAVVLGAYLVRKFFFGSKEGPTEDQNNDNNNDNNNDTTGENQTPLQTPKSKLTGSKLLWLRAETKEGERRTAVTPSNAKALIKEGYDVHVERSEMRIFSDEDYEFVGCTLEPAGSWTTAPAHAIILGLKELPESTEPLSHVHVFFAHCYKGQAGWKQLLQRFAKGGGVLLDLEFLLKDGRRVAAFGEAAGMVGAGVALLQWAEAQRQPGLEPSQFPACTFWQSRAAMVEDVKMALGDRKPSSIVFGALGRSGRGAAGVLKEAGLTPTEWDLPETKGGGPFKQILEHDLMFNCILLNSKIPPFLTRSMLDEKDRKLSVICDVSCDNSNPNNPIPFFNVSTTLKQPVVELAPAVDEAPRVLGISIDHLPTLLPRESSISFSDDLLAYLVTLNSFGEDPVWAGALELFHKKLEEAK